MTSSNQLAERLASVLASAVRSSEEAGSVRRRDLAERRMALAHRRELVDRADLLDGELAAALDALQQAKVAVDQLEAERRRVDKEDESTAAAIEQTRDELKLRCRQAVEGLPTLDPTGFDVWLGWLEDWHVDAGRPFEEAPDWPRYLANRRVVDDALLLLEPALDTIRALDAIRTSQGESYDELRAEIEEMRGETARLSARIDSVLSEAAGRFGQIARDLPTPRPAAECKELDHAEGLLRYIEGLLGRFAASAEQERCMLEALR